MKKKRVAETWSDAQLAAYSNEHLKSEMGMFFGTGILLSTTEFPTDDRADIYRNALIESFATQLRNLVFFLDPNRVKQWDVLAHDFFADPSKDWLACRPKMPALSDLRTRSHREVSHMTVDRRNSGDPSKNWDFPRIMQELMVPLKAFVDNASPKKLHPDVKAFCYLIDLTPKIQFTTDPSTKSVFSSAAGATNSIWSISFTFPSGKNPL